MKITKNCFFHNSLKILLHINVWSDMCLNPNSAENGSDILPPV